MKRFTKSLIALAMLVAGTMGANAKTLDADLSKLPATSENTTWDSATNTFAWSGTSYNSTEIFGSGNYSAYTTLTYNITAGSADHFRIIVKYTNGAPQTTAFASCSENGSLSFEDMGVDPVNLLYVQTIRLSGANDVTGDVKVNSISLEGPDIVYIEATKVYEAPAGTIDVKDLTGTYSNWANTVIYPKEFAVQGQCFGDGDGSAESTHVDIDGYDYICFQVTSATENTAGLRIWIWDDVTNSVVTLYAYPIADYATATFTQATKISAAGTYVAKISGYKYLKGVKAANDWGSSAATVSMAWVSKGDAPVSYVDTGKYLLIGESIGSVSLNTALSDATATCFDVTGVTGSGITLDAANPNALFIANEGTLANTKNVIVDGVCANLELTDKYPFMAPAAFTATAAKFTKTVDSDYATMLIPFGASVPSDVEAYEITGNDGDVLTTNMVESVEANKPVMLKNNGTFEFTAEGVEIAKTAEAAQNNGLLNGVYAATAVPTENTYVLQKQGEDVNFYKAISGLTVNPFRAYLTAAAGAARLTFDFNEATGIKTVKTTEGTEVYNLQGVRVANPTKGLYIVNGKKVIK